MQIAGFTLAGDSTRAGTRKLPVLETSPSCRRCYTFAGSARMVSREPAEGPESPSETPLPF